MSELPEVLSEMESRERELAWRSVLAWANELEKLAMNYGEPPAPQPSPKVGEVFICEGCGRSTYNLDAFLVCSDCRYVGCPDCYKEKHVDRDGNCNERLNSLPRQIEMPIPVAQRAVDALCRGHKACLQLDCARSVLNGKEEVEESPLTKALETSMNEMRQALEAAGIAW